jgi:phosphoribosylformylglycinamidine synthase
MVMADTMRLPGLGAGLVRVHGTSKILAFTSDVTPRYVAADAYEGGKQAVAEAWRNLVATGAKPLAATDNLNFGNPEKPEIMGQFVRAIEGIGEACRVLDFPIVSGNVSLYNETNGVGILPTPTIAGVGLLPDAARMARIAFASAGDEIFLVGGPPLWGGHLGQSLLLRDVLGRTEGPPPPVDLDLERKVGDFVRGLIRDELATAVHDCSDGGLAVALAEMAIASGTGATLFSPAAPNETASFFGEDQARYLLTTSSYRCEADLDAFLDRARGAGIPLMHIGTVGGDTLKLGTARAISVEELRTAHEGWFPAYMQGE